jgi:hypothetical protein
VRADQIAAASNQAGDHFNRQALACFAIAASMRAARLQPSLQLLDRQVINRWQERSVRNAWPMDKESVSSGENNRFR